MGRRQRDWEEKRKGGTGIDKLKKIKEIINYVNYDVVNTPVKDNEY